MFSWKPYFDRHVFQILNFVVFNEKRFNFPVETVTFLVIFSFLYWF